MIAKYCSKECQTGASQEPLIAKVLSCSTRTAHADSLAIAPAADWKRGRHKVSCIKAAAVSQTIEAMKPMQKVMNKKDKSAQKAMKSAR
jgi:hypothetical protein